MDFLTELANKTIDFLNELAREMIDFFDKLVEKMIDFFDKLARGAIDSFAAEEANDWFECISRRADDFERDWKSFTIFTERSDF